MSADCTRLVFALQKIKLYNIQNSRVKLEDYKMSSSEIIYQKCSQQIFLK